MTGRRIPDTEAFIHHIWHNQEFDHTDLRTDTREVLQVLHPGTPNPDAGPDFRESRLTINGVNWSGQVEIHINSSDWLAHGHHNDRAYDSVILHVVWNNDFSVSRTDGTPIPTFQIAERVNPALMENFSGFDMSEPIPCEKSFSQVPSEETEKMIVRAFAERMEHKAAEVQDLLRSSRNDWQLTAYRMLLRGLGMNKNREMYLMLGRQVPWLKWSLLDLLRKEALLFGQAGFLHECTDEYMELLRKEYLYLKYKWSLPDPLPAHNWQFLRMRPHSFPTLRLAQLAAIVDRTPYLLQALRESATMPEIREIFRAVPSTYWQHHYSFHSSSIRHSGIPGKGTIDRLIINSVLPLLFAYSDWTGREEIKIKLAEMMSAMPPEKNRLIRNWNAVGLDAVNALYSQGAIGLYKLYCRKKKCMHCEVGRHLIARNLS